MLLRLWQMTRVSVWHPIASCPLELVPNRVVEKYGASFSVLCRPTITYVELEIFGWETPVGTFNVTRTDTKSATWYVEKLKDRTLKPSCFGTFNDGHQCAVDLPITLYSKSSTSNNDHILTHIVVLVIPDGCFFTDTPETVSVSVQNHDGPLREGRGYTLRCDVSSVAPAAALTVSWLRMGEIVKTQTYKDNSTEPKNVSSTLEVTAFRNNMDEMITCRTTFDPKQEGPSEQFHTSKSYKVIVNCKLVIF